MKHEIKAGDRFTNEDVIFEVISVDGNIVWSKSEDARINGKDSWSFEWGFDKVSAIKNLIREEDIREQKVA